MLTSDKDDIHYILLLLLICLRHKFEGDNDFVIACKNHTQMIKFLKSLHASDKIKYVYVSNAFWSEYSEKNKLINLQEVFEFYSRLLDGDLNISEINLRRDNRFNYQDEISIQLCKNKSISRSGKYIESHDLGSYFDLLSQAGRMVVSV